MLLAHGLINTGVIMTAVITGGEQLAKISADLKALSATKLEAELNTAMKAAARPAIDHMREALGRDLPQGGGLARTMHNTRFSLVHARRGLRIRASHRYQLRLIDQGKVRHPLFGNRDHWYTTMITERILTDAWEQNAERVRQEMIKAGQHAMDQIGR